jgi:hypothetical protein
MGSMIQNIWGTKVYPTAAYKALAEGAIGMHLVAGANYLFLWSCYPRYEYQLLDPRQEQVILLDQGTLQEQSVIVVYYGYKLSRPWSYKVKLMYEPNFVMLTITPLTK